ncbi:MAG: fibronectin type III-like domain-contianing protein [Desulfobacterota bacterium]|nr:fibronectin type III-like domain-contianing protein [Thermodesulfobacteriota bacterium]
MRELKGFTRVTLAPGESRRVELMLPIERLAYYDVEDRCWRIEPITYRVEVGSSSRAGDLLTGHFHVRG